MAQPRQYITNTPTPITSTCNALTGNAEGFAVVAECTGVPPTTGNAVNQFEHGCIMTRTDSGTGNAALYENTGSRAVPSWNLIGAISPGEITLARGFVLIGNSSGVAAAVDANNTGQILVGDGTDLLSVAITGDITLAASGLTAIASGVIVNADVNASAAIDFSKLATLTSGNILVGSAGNVATSVAMSGNVTISNTGVTTIGSISLEVATVTNIASTEILIGTGAGTAAFAALSGDATMTSGGVVTVTGATGAFQAGGAITNAGATLVVPFFSSAAPQALSGPGAANTTTYQTRYTSTGTGDVVTLAVATRIGHMKKVTYVAENAGGDTAVVTPAAATGFTTATLNAIGDYVVMMWDGAGWLLNDYYGATIA